MGSALGAAALPGQGNGVIQWRQKWPRWKPPNEMVARRPELAKCSIENGGMEQGLKNPLSARALCIFAGGGHALSSARQSAMAFDWQGHFVRLCAPAQPGHYRPL